MKEYIKPEFHWIDLRMEEKFAAGSGGSCDSGVGTDGSDVGGLTNGDCFCC